MSPPAPTGSSDTQPRPHKGVAVSSRPPTGEGALVTVLKEDGHIVANRDPKLPEDTLLYLYKTMVRRQL